MKNIFKGDTMIRKYSLYIILPLVALALMLIGYLIGLSSANYAHQNNTQGFETSFHFTSDEPDWR